MQAISAAGLSTGDVAIGISYSGETRNTVETLEMARKQGATIIAIVNFTDSTMVEIADIIVPTSVTRHVFPDGSLGGRIAQLFTIDVLFIKLFISDPDRFRRAYRKYNEILMNKVKKERSRSGERREAHQERESSGEGRTPANEILKLLGG